MDAACHLTPIQKKKKKTLVMPRLFMSQFFVVFFPHSVAVRAALVRVGR